MKSIMQEDSSIMKAVEKAWINAGKPHEFSIKIYEEPEKNFLGFLKKTAKIGIFFQETEKRTSARSITPSSHSFTETSKTKPVASHKTKIKNAKNGTQRVSSDFIKTSHTSPSASTKVTEEKKEATEQQSRKVTTESSSKQRILWTEDMVSLANSWLKNALKAMDKDISFVHELNKYYLKFTFSMPLADTPEKERQVYRNFSFLMMQSLKKQLRRPLRGFKIILTS